MLIRLLNANDLIGCGGDNQIHTNVVGKISHVK